MGGNNSRLNGGGGEVLPAKIRPLLHHRMEEFRKGRNGGKEGTLSKKQLLKDDGVVAAEDENENEDNNNISPQETQPVNEQSVARVEKLSKVVPLPVSESRTGEKCNNEHKDQDQGKVRDVENKSAGPQPENYKDEEAYVEHGDDDDDEEEDDDDSGRLIGPGSPSFKIYCIETEKTEEEESSEEEQTIAMHQKTPSVDSVESAASGNSNEIVEIELAPKRKERKRKKLGAVKKNLLNVKNLHMNRMNPMFACTGNDRRSLLSER